LRGPKDDPFSDGIVFDAVRIRLVEIGEAAKGLDEAVRMLEPSIPWGAVIRMRDRLAHRYFDTTDAVVATTAIHDLPVLRAAVERLLARPEISSG
jgi:uncharacterized protein with HEPN domain